MENNNYQQMAERLTHIEGQVGTIGKEVKEMAGNVLRITELLKGNEYNGSGLVHTINAHAKEIDFLKDELRRIDEKHEKRFNALKWVVVGTSLTSGFGISKVLEFFTK